jgi:hypothetical protein
VFYVLPVGSPEIFRLKCQRTVFYVECWGCLGMPPSQIPRFEAVTVFEKNADSAAFLGAVTWTLVVAARILR